MTGSFVSSGLGSFPAIMGILNVTPDSFSGDGLMVEDDYVAASVRLAEQMIADGAGILDIGGESSRPGSVPINAEEEKQRVIPVIMAIRRKFPDVPISIDTVKPGVAAAALKTGANIINDISGEKHGSAMYELAAKSGCHLVVMHNGSEAAVFETDEKLGNMYGPVEYEDVIAEVLNSLKRLAQKALDAGVLESRILVDPGLGFGKTVEQNLRLVNNLNKLKALGFPVLVGPSRKSFIGRTLRLPPGERLEGTAAVAAASVLRGADIIRVHDVKEIARVVKMAAAIRNSG